KTRSSQHQFFTQMGYFVHQTAVIDENCDIGEDVKIWHFTHLMPGCKVGNNSVIGQNVFIASNVEVGKNVHIQNNVSLYEGIRCEDDVFIGPSVVFTNIKNPRSEISRKNQFVKTVICKGATIGANATIICGNEIGRYAFIAAGAVVTKPVVSYALVAGNPARQKGWMSEAGGRLNFNKEGLAKCAESNQPYMLQNNSVIKIKS
ncbi:MAG: acyltransferase, partial [Flavisolibacter sp.]